MKTKLPSRFARTLSIAALLVTPLCARAQDGTWTNLLSVDPVTQIPAAWSTNANWLNGVLPNTNGTAYFNTLDVPDGTNIMVNVDYDIFTGIGYAVGNLSIGDTDTSSAGSWTFNDGGLGLLLDNENSPYSVIDVDLATGGTDNLVNGWATATMNVVLNGTNTVVKTGPAQLLMNEAAANGYTGGTIISNGMIRIIGSGASLGSGPVTFYGGSLQTFGAAIPGSNPSVNATPRPNFPNDIIVPTGATGTIYLAGRPETLPANSGAVSGGGTLNMFVDYLRGNIGGDWTAFTGQINAAATTRRNAEFRFDAQFVPSSWANNSLHITENGINANTLSMRNAGLASGTIVEFGELSASIPGIVTAEAFGGVNNGGSGNAPYVMQVGALNTDASFSGNFGGNVGIIKVGTGTWTLNGDSVANTGMTVINGGTLQIGSGESGTLGLSPVVTNNATLAFGRSDEGLVVTNVIDGPGAVMQSGSGRTTLSPLTGTNTYTGKTIITDGVLAPDSQLALGAVPGSFVADQVTLNGGSLVAAADVSYDSGNRGITLGAAGGGLGADGANTLTVANIIGGSGNLTINNSGTVTLTGANTYTGKTILEGGTLLLAAEALGAAPGAPTADQVTFDGGTLRSSATFAIDDANRGITVNAAGGTVSPDAATTLTISEPIVGAGTLTKIGAGNLVLNGAVSANLMVGEGTVQVGASGSLTSPSIELPDGTTLDVSAAGLTLGAGQTLSGNGTVLGNLTANAGSTLSAGASVGAITVSGNLTMDGATNAVEISSTTNDVIHVTGNLTLSGVNTIALTLLESLPVGTYHLIQADGGISGTTGNLALMGYPTSRVTGSLAINGNFVDLVVSGTAGSLVWQGGLNGNAWDLNTTMNWLNGGVGDVFLASDNVTFDATGAANSTVNLAETLVPGTATVNASTDYTFSGSGKLSSFASVVKSGSGTLTLLTPNDYSGTTTINAGTVQVGDGATSGALGSGDIANDGALVFNLPDGLTNAGAISGTGSLSLQAGNLALDGDNSYSGATTIAGGSILQAGTGGASGSLGSGAVTDNGTLVFNRTGSVTNDGAIGGTGDLTVQGGGTVALAADNGYSGATTVDDGTLQIGAGGTTGTLGSSPTAIVNANGTLAFNRSDAVTNSLVLTGEGALRQEGSGTLVVVSSNSYGATLIDAASVLQISDGDPSRYYNTYTTNIDAGNMTTNVVTNFHATVAIGTGDITVDGTLVVNQAHPSTLANTINGSGSLMQVGAGTLTIQRDQPNAYSGGTVISNATVILAATPGLGGQALNDAVSAVNGAGLGTGTLTFLGNSVLQPEWATRQDPNSGVNDNISIPINIPAGQTGTLWAPGRYQLSSDVTGSGTFNLGVNYVRGDITGDWSGFTGLLNVISNAVNVDGTTAFLFRVNNANAFPNTMVNLGDAVEMFGRANRMFFVGELSGTSGSFLEGSTGSQGANATWIIGGLNTDATFDGTIRDAITIIKEGTGTWTLTAANSYTGTTTVSNGVLALAAGAFGEGDISSSASINIASPGVLDVTGRSDGTLGAFGALAGDGTINGNVNSLGNVAPGFSIGTLTVNGDATVGNVLDIEVDRSASQTSDKLIANNIVLQNVTVNITNIGPNLLSGDTFTVLQANGGSISGNVIFVNAPIPPGATTAGWDTSMLAVNGTITITNAPPPPPLTTVLSPDGTTLDFSWPIEYTGYQLVAQTNALDVGITPNWSPIAGTEGLNSYTGFAIDQSNACVFVTLRYPPLP